MQRLQMIDAKNSACSADPFRDAQMLVDHSHLRVRRITAPDESAARWHRRTHSTTLVWAEGDGVAVQIRKPPYRHTLQRGEFYAVPANVDMAVFSTTQARAGYVMFEYGERLDVVISEPPTLGFVIERSKALHSTAHDSLPDADQPSFDYAALRGGFSRMEVLAFHDQIRLLVQGHAKGDCVPWHSHDDVTDTFFCTAGVARIATRNPDQEFVLQPGDSCQVDKGQPHFASGLAGSACEFLILQWGGHYNYVAR